MLRRIAARTDNRIYLVEAMVEATVSPNVQIHVPADGGQLGTGSFTPGYSALPISSLATAAGAPSEWGGGGLATQQTASTANFAGSYSFVSSTLICGGFYYYQQQVAIGGGSGAPTYTSSIYTPGQKQLAPITSCAGGWRIYGAGVCGC